MNIEKAVEIIGNRRADNRLVEKTLAYLGQDVPDIFRSSKIPIVTTPYVAGGTRAEIQSTKAIRTLGYAPVRATYCEDAFTTTNALKVNIWRPKIAWPKGQITRQWVVAPEYRNSGAAVGEAPTVFGPDVQTYQAQLGALAFARQQTEPPQTVDFSGWYARMCDRRNLARCAEVYYPYVMAAYAVFGVMYRYETDNPINLSFRQRTTNPACEYVMNQLGAEPVIVGAAYPIGGDITELGMLSNEEVLNLQKYGTIEANYE